ncbi:hypothetical protein CONPUDRAFT_136541 [Coniophora puteana RWD-64-598 SS2]|uniref:Uncharacterized protein n=1 Tax=Coniophora puteana (strain RWD-64-598) TaxID=741705 RepID=A0A5M3MRH5_CONPW|nr:uncharacterized protein CONPUDRAFT_136541 [Coniophora puteana RWD-64-598 SS2]EIW81753.1 hypothetical protein CONPUDRAFT_136541 [Coniophora puteana RWD-64-598 SS2]
MGMPVCEVIARGGDALSRMMVGASDHVGQGMDGGSRKISLSIVWPGHESANWAHSIELYTPLGPLTRAQLAVLVSQMIFSFVEATGQFPPSRCPEWRVGANGISLDRLYLAGLWNTSSDMWMTEILVDTR